MNPDAALTMLFGLVCVLIPAVLLLAFWLWMLIECLAKESPKENEKLVWAVVMLLVGPLGAILYFFIRRPKRKQDLGS